MTQFFVAAPTPEVQACSSLGVGQPARESFRSWTAFSRKLSELSVGRLPSHFRRGRPQFLQQIAFVAATLLGAVACAGPTKSLYPPRAGETPRTVFVINHGALHTGLAVKRSDIPRGVWPANRDYSGFKYLEVGWGDDDGYRKPLTSGIAMKALAGSKRTVLLSDGFRTLRTRLDNPKFSIVEVDLSDRGFARLCRHIEQTYALDEAGQGKAVAVSICDVFGNEHIEVFTDQISGDR